MTRPAPQPPPAKPDPTDPLTIARLRVEARWAKARTTAEQIARLSDDARRERIAAMVDTLRALGGILPGSPAAATIADPRERGAYCHAARSLTPAVDAMRDALDAAAGPCCAEARAFGSCRGHGSTP